MSQCNAPWLEAALTIIKKWEGCKLTAYPDPGTGGDPWTIGWGQTGPTIRKGVVWTQAQADAALLAEVVKFGNGVEACVTAPMTANQKAACTSLAYNIGINAFRKSTLLTLLNRGSHAAAADQFLRWNRAAGRPMKGLTNRRAEERALFVRA